MSDSNSLFNPQAIAVALAVVAVVYLYFRHTNNESQLQPQHGPPVPHAQPPAKLERLPVGKLSLSELAKYNGANNSRILVSVCGRIFDLTKGRDFYGHPDGPYNCFAGADASYMLGSMSLDVAHRNKTDFEQDGEHQITLSDWISRYRSKYPIVGRLEGFEKLCPGSWREAGDDDVVADDIQLRDIYATDLKTISVSELSESAKYDKDNSWLSVCGIVFNVQSAEIVYESMYGDFVGALGNDISVALATKQFSEDTYNEAISGLQNDTQKINNLKKCLKLFAETYPIMGLLQDEENKYKLENIDAITEEECDLIDENEVNEAKEAPKEDEFE